MPTPSSAEVGEALTRLGLKIDGPPLSSRSSVVRPVTVDGLPAVLKVTNQPEELAGVRALQNWNGNGAVRVLAREGNAILFERAWATLGSLLASDGAATEALCAVADRLHANNRGQLVGFPSLRSRFGALFADTRPRFDEVRAIADQLLGHVERPVLLHGDLHHKNVLRSADRGWVAIDPKGIIGAREFDYCNIFTNSTSAEAVGFFDSRLRIVTGAAGIERVDLLRWIASWSALSGIWHREDGDFEAASRAHSVNELAMDRLRVSGVRRPRRTARPPEIWGGHRGH